MMNYNTIDANMSKDTMNNYKNVKGYRTLRPKIIEFNENYTSSTMLAAFLNKVKPIEGGILIFQTTYWAEFPATREEAINTGKIWSTAFSRKKTHKDVTVNIYFDIENRTITFKVKPYNTHLIEIENEKMEEITCRIINDIDSRINEKNIANSITNSYIIKNCENYPLFDNFKNASKDLAIKIESSIDNLKDTYCAVVFMKTTGINVTIKRKIILNTCNNIFMAEEKPKENTNDVTEILQEENDVAENTKNIIEMSQEDNAKNTEIIQENNEAIVGDENV